METILSSRQDPEAVVGAHGERPGTRHAARRQGVPRPAERLRQREPHPAVNVTSLPF